MIQTRQSIVPFTLALVSACAMSADDFDVDATSDALIANDSSVQEIFTFAKQPCSGGEFPVCPQVHATFVRHAPNSHPQGDAADSSDLVWYVNASLTLSQNKKVLSGEAKAWRNTHQAARPAFFGNPAVPADAFVNENNQVTFFISVTDTGVASIQMKLKSKPVGGLPPRNMVATYIDGAFVERNGSHSDSLSFRLK
jgi:hypothetical protein